MDRPVGSILCLNRGSSSLKAALYLFGAEERLIPVRSVARLGRAAVGRIFAELERLRLPSPTAVAHRLVHGGAELAQPRRVTPALLRRLIRLIPLAPLHLPRELELVRAVSRRYPGLPQVACFDTAFHRAMPALAQRFPLPRPFWDEGVRRYGFHGLSYEFVASRLPRRGRAIVAHLGGGASLIALRDRRPLDTSMGLTPLGGVMMGTRTGDLDPGVPLYLMREKGWGARRLQRLLSQESGLLGVSGLTSDMKDLLARGRRSPDAAEAVAMFCGSVRKEIGALATVLGGLDLLVFTGGIGERAAPVRREICRGLEHLGLLLDARRNSADAEVISVDESSCSVRVIPTNEELMMGRHARAVLRQG